MLDHFDICGKRFLISGASSGLGLGMVDSFIEQGAQVVGLGRNASLFMELESKYGSSFEGIRIDLSKTNEIESVLMGLITGKFDGFVHAAGVIYRRPIKLMTSDTFTETMNVNVISGGLIAKFLLKSKRLNPGASLVYISSVASDYAAIGNTMYMSSKGAVNSMVRGLALEFSKYGVRVNGIEPGLIKTHLTDGISSDEINAAITQYPLGRLGEIKDVENAVQFALSGASSWMTGQFLRIDGGLTLK
jgi:NAD(P)-dependent dehydrogenase (short-subunit alcohol dehydrogenase family)